MSESRGLCGCCAKFLISAAITALIIWISFRFTKPRYYLVAFSIPAPNSSAVTASFRLEIENRNRQVGIYHDDIALTLLAGPNLSSPVSHFIIPKFYQGHLKTAEKLGNFSAAKNLTGFAGDSVFRVSVESAYRFKVLGRKTSHHAVKASGTVEVDDGGEKTARKGIRLSSSGADVVRPLVTVVVLLYTLGLHI
ncbi:hypothetical protein KSP40_PGU016790 [Platanthera guangdongensis]|uniref:Late embryogenesis abundant protein LEA-2 subgroup domain-containing protein n=1 Tax=Platanthera guangdongensis TaxID=2320717 RepID=A0ABR2LX48_9ASPA